MLRKDGASEVMDLTGQVFDFNVRPHGSGLAITAHIIRPLSAPIGHYPGVSWGPSRSISA